MYKREEAVSPVIGVILMVAITVILAAVIAAFVFGMAGNVDKTKVVSVTGERTNSSAIKLTNFGGQDVGKLGEDPYAFNISVNGAKVNDKSTTAFLSRDVGSVMYFPTSPSNGAGKDDVTVTAWFVDGKSSVIYTSKL
jgi:archaeal type IV pilus assembly protein PilA